MSAAALKQTTLEEDLAHERAFEEKHDYEGGQFIAMAGCNRRHDGITGNLVSALRRALESSPCESFTADMKVHTPATGRWKYPDASLACEPAFFDAVEDMLMNPCVVFEVLSDSTEAHDRGKKFALYRSIPSFQEYVLVSQHQMLVEHYTRQADGTWNLKILPAGATLRLNCASVEIPVRALYAKVRVDAAR